jgi:hypothetical protein
MGFEVEAVGLGGWSQLRDEGYGKGFGLNFVILEVFDDDI